MKPEKKKLSFIAAEDLFEELLRVGAQAELDEIRRHACAQRMTPAQVLAAQGDPRRNHDAMDEIASRGRRRLHACSDPTAVGLFPAELDWLHPGELAELDALRLEWIRAQPTPEDVRERVQKRRAARREARRYGI